MCLNKELFRAACKKLQFSPNIDLFASRINYQIKPFVSYHPDPEAMATNAFHMSWVDYKFYAFPPFSIVSQVLQKMRDGSEGLVLVPKWPTQTWRPAAMQMLVQRPIVLTNMEDMLFLLSNPTEKHPLHEWGAPGAMPFIRQQLESRGLSPTVTEVIEKSWQPSTKKQYTSYLSRWKLYCGKRNIKPICPFKALIFWVNCSNLA